MGSMAQDMLTRTPASLRAEIVEAGMNAPSEIGVQPSHLHSWSNFWYFVAYIVVVSYTLLNLYIGEGMQCGVHPAVCLQHLLVASATEPDVRLRCCTAGANFGLP
jgi:hypothetical protein